MHEPDAVTRGGCICGAVRYRASGAPRVVCNCYCSSCRKSSGGSMVTWATYADACLQIEQGELVFCNTSPEATRGHCARCGTSLTYRHTQRAGEVDITVASLDNPGDMHPTLHIWTEDKPAWLVIADGLPQFTRIPP